jgi:hypothetical protein
MGLRAHGKGEGLECGEQTPAPLGSLARPKKLSPLTLTTDMCWVASLLCRTKWSTCAGSTSGATGCCCCPPRARPSLSARPGSSRTAFGSTPAARSATPTAATLSSGCSAQPRRRPNSARRLRCCRATRTLDLHLAWLCGRRDGLRRRSRRTDRRWRSSREILTRGSTWRLHWPICGALARR